MTVELLSRDFEPRETRPLPWRIVVLAVVLVVTLGVAVATVARRSGGNGSGTVSIGVLTAAQAKTAASNDFRLRMKLGLSGQVSTCTKRSPAR